MEKNYSTTTKPFIPKQVGVGYGEKLLKKCTTFIISNKENV
jgi:hypothetical protein